MEGLFPIPRMIVPDTRCWRSQNHEVSFLMYRRSEGIDRVIHSLSRHRVPL